MNLHLTTISQRVAPGAHAVLRRLRFSGQSNKLSADRSKEA
jgi:hypothetical protein